MKAQVTLILDLPGPGPEVEALYEQPENGPTWQEAWVQQQVYDILTRPALRQHGEAMIGSLGGTMLGARHPAARLRHVNIHSDRWNILAAAQPSVEIQILP